MKRKEVSVRGSVLVLTAVASVLSLGLAAAEEEPGVERNRFAIGPELQSFNYREPGVMKEDGVLYGIYVEYGLEMPHILFEASASYAWGTLRYDGGRTTITGRTIPLQLDTPNQILNVRVAGGQKWKDQGTGLEFVSYLGAGYRFLVDDLPSAWGYRREQTYFYLPLGVRVRGGASSPWKWSLRAEYDIFISGHNDSGGSSFHQDTGYGAMAAVGIERGIAGAGGAKLGLETYVQYWKVAESTVSWDGFVEPDNESTTIGVRIVARY